MIWFSCSKCGKTHGRPENSIGTLVFCDCGQGNSVPWESTAAEPPPQQQAAAAGAAPAAASPTLAPLTFESPSSPGTGSPAAPRIDDMAARRRRGVERRDPNFCLNHSTAVRSASCEDCGESFCPSCLVSLEGATLCGPCKNFRVRSLELPPRTSNVAIFSLLIAVFTGAVLTFCLLPFGRSTAVSILALLTILPQLLALGLGIRGLYLVQQDGGSRHGGQAWAVTGVATAGLCITLTLLLSLYGLHT